MSLSSDLIQLAHLVRLSGEEAQQLVDIPQEARSQLQLLSSRVLTISNELETLAVAVALAVVDPNAVKT